MRINVYAEEVTGETGRIVKTVTDDRFGKRRFHGVRLFLASPDVLHHSPEDDDRSAITLWVPWTSTGGHDFQTTRAALQGLIRNLNDAENEERRRTNADNR